MIANAEKKKCGNRRLEQGLIIQTTLADSKRYVLYVKIITEMSILRIAILYKLYVRLLADMPMW